MRKTMALLVVLALVAATLSATVFPFKAASRTAVVVGGEALSSSSPLPSNSTAQSTPTPTVEPRQTLPSAFIIMLLILGVVAVFYAAFSLSLREISKKKIRKIRK
jgi:hypothetical protein